MAASDPPLAAVTDEMAGLISRIAESRDREAFQALFVHYGPRVKGLLLRKGADPDVAEDLMQETMLAVWNKAALYHPARGSVATWIFTIARNLRIDRLRKESSQHFEDIDGMEIGQDSVSHLPASVAQDDQVIAREEGAYVVEALSELPPEQAQILQLAFVDDLSQREIAEQLSLPLGTVKSRMRLAYRKLKLALENRL
ncbi:sigma-70 family RNA polymerase sigma factor [Lutibaculum baratangense]|nr:sigma-70 family RNA polymerase sigma factor [Lutibaculum baratangense]